MQCLSTRGICTANIVTIIQAVYTSHNLERLIINFCGTSKIIPVNRPFSTTKRLDALVPNSIFDGTPNEDGPLIIIPPIGMGITVWTEFINSGKPINFPITTFEVDPADVIPMYVGRQEDQIWAYPTGHEGDDPW